MVRDPIPLLQTILRSFLRAASDKIELDGIIGGNVPWRPHLLERAPLRGWYIHVATPLTESWIERIRRAKAIRPKLQIGIAATEELFANEEFLQVCHELNAAVLIFKSKGDTFIGEELFPSIEDYVYNARLKLSPAAARGILDGVLSQALAEKNKQRKGVLLEVLVAVLLSQVDGFEVADVGISNRTQQMDVLVHNRNVGGALGSSPIVIAEAKNWKDPIDTSEYAAFVRKMESRHDRSRLGFLVTTSRFTAGVGAERRRESMKGTLVVLIDGQTLPSLWRSQKSITACVERITITATVGT